MEESKLREIIAENKAQAVGSGYYEIIVSRENYRNFVKTICDSGFKITGICWWEYVPSIDQKNIYGMGGPPSKYFPGWYAEIGFGDDEFATMPTAEEVISTIENKAIKFHALGTHNFGTAHWMTPAFILDLPDSWQGRL